MRYLEVRYLVYYHFITLCKMVVYQAPNLKVPHHYAKMERLCLCSAAILITKKLRFGGFRSCPLDLSFVVLLTPPSPRERMAAADDAAQGLRHLLRGPPARRRGLHPPMWPPRLLPRLRQRVVGAAGGWLLLLVYSRIPDAIYISAKS